MDEPTASRVETLVHDLAMKRLLDGQFDECDLTMRELELIERSMVKTLMGIYHGRIGYPSTSGLTGPGRSRRTPRACGAGGDTAAAGQECLTPPISGAPGTAGAVLSPDDVLMHQAIRKVARDPCRPVGPAHFRETRCAIAAPERILGAGNSLPLVRSAGLG